MIVQRDPLHPDVALMLARLAAHNKDRYGSSDLSDAPPDSWDCAFVAYLEQQPAGLIAVRPRDGDAHVQRLYVEPSARGTGLTMALARAALEYARSAGYRRAVWDTGADLPEVLATSAHLGASEVTTFGAHKDSPLTRCFELDLHRPSVMSAVRETLFHARARVRAQSRRWSRMDVTSVIPAVEVEEMSVEDGRRMLHEQTSDKLGIGREEFLSRLDSGVYQDTEDEAILRLAMLAPFGR